MSVIEEIEKSDIEKKIIEAAKEVFLSQGFENTTMQSIANKAKISRTSLNYYYRTKDKLFEAIIKDIINIFVPRLKKIAKSKVNLQTRIELIIDLYTEFIIQNPLYPNFILMEIKMRPKNFIKIISLEIESIDELNQMSININNDLKKINPPINLQTLILSIASLIIFPTIVWPVFKNFEDQSTNDFSLFMTNRKVHIKKMSISLLN